MTDFIEPRAVREWGMGDALKLFIRAMPQYGEPGYPRSRKFYTPEGIVEPADQRMGPPAFGYIDSAEAQKLANDLWEAGIRPEQSKTGQGMTDAMARHLADMRAIVADRLKVPLT